jgi:DNA-binding transcriptional MerR regulator
MEALLNSKQVMQLLGIKSETTLIKYEKEGLIKPFTRLGNRKRYSTKSIKGFLGE